MKTDRMTKHFLGQRQQKGRRAKEKKRKKEEEKKGPNEYLNKEWGSQKKRRRGKERKESYSLLVYIEECMQCECALEE